MGKNKLKCVIFFVSFLMLLFLNTKNVSASNYDVTIIDIENLNYGDTLKDANIVGQSDIEGDFSFYDNTLMLDRIGEREFEIVFTPDDLDNYEIRKIYFKDDIEPRKISIVFDAPLYKQYDGTYDLLLPGYSLVGIIDNEVNVEGNLTAVLSGAYVGEGISVILSGLEISGEKNAYYYIDFEGHSARIHPSYLEKEGQNATKIVLDKGVYIDVDASLRVVKEEISALVNEKYNAFLIYHYGVYDHNNELVNVDSKYRISMDIDEEIIKKERMVIFEVTSEGEYKELSYSYKNGKINFVIDSDSKIVFTTRNIEYELIFLFIAILIFSFVFVLAYCYKNSKIKGDKSY